MEQQIQMIHKLLKICSLMMTYKEVEISSIKVIIEVRYKENLLLY